MLIYIIVSALTISLASLVGIFTLSLKEKILDKIIFNLIALSSGAMLGGAFLHLIPEGLEKIDKDLFFLILLISLAFYLLIEKILHWRHCHKKLGECEIHESIGYINLIGDSIHNFIDGLTLAISFQVDFKLGLMTTLAILIHEIPQEIGDFGVLIYAGFTKKRALILNFLVALTVILGGIIGYFISQFSKTIIDYFIPIAAGGFIYIAATDLLPEIRKIKHKTKFIINFIFIFLGIILMYLIKFIH